MNGQRRPTLLNTVVSAQMQRMPRSSTGPEVLIRRELRRRSLRFRVNHPRLPGRPDIAFTSARIAVFVDGCFWHACTGLDANGHPWAALAVTSNLRMSGVLLRKWLPSHFRSVRLAATDGLGDACGTVVYNADNGFTHGLSPYLRRFDIRVGECLLLTADLEWETVQITHGDRELLLGPPASGGAR
jgi:hypothetical protein